MKSTVFDIQNLVRPNVKKMKPYSSARDEYQSTGTDMIFLDANENPYQTDVNRYPDPHQRSLKEELSLRKGVDSENIVLGNGSDEILDLLFRAFCNPKKDNIISLPPTYGMYKVLAELNEVENREVLLSNNFEPRIPEILGRADQNTKLLFLCSPNNPTGNTFSKEIIEELLNNFNGLIVIDEAYIDFSGKESWVRNLKDYPNLIVTQTLSKAYGMAGIRLGICYASTEITGILKKIKPPYNVNQLTQQRALSRLLQEDAVKTEISSLVEWRNSLAVILRNEIPYVTKVYDSDANFLLVKVDDANRRYKQLLEKGIVIRNRNSQPLCENTLRLTIGTVQENNQLVEALKSMS